MKDKTSAEDFLAALVGDAPSMNELVKRAKGEDKNDKSFMALIKIYTITYMAGLDKNSKSILQPVLDIDKAYHQQLGQFHATCSYLSIAIKLIRFYHPLSCAGVFE